jgi:CRP-like cAMP-binding protein
MEVDALSAVPFLSGLSQGDIESLASTLRRRRYARNEVVFHRDDPGNSLFMVASGSVKICLRSEDGREVVLTRHGPGEHFGDLALFDGEPRSADAIALEQSELLILPRELFLQFIHGNPEAALRLLTTLAGWIRRLTETVHDAAFLDVPGRLARTLLRLTASQAGGEPVATTPRMTQNDLAAMVGATRESINKWLGFYERQGLIRRDKGSIAVLSREELERRAR